MSFGKRYARRIQSKPKSIGIKCAGLSTEDQLDPKSMAQAFTAMMRERHKIEQPWLAAPSPGRQRAPRCKPKPLVLVRWISFRSVATGSTPGKYEASSTMR